MGSRAVAQAAATAMFTGGIALIIAGLNPAHFPHANLLLWFGIALVTTGASSLAGLFFSKPESALGHPGAGAAYMSPYEVVHYLSDETVWGQKKGAERVRDGMRKVVLLEAFDEFRVNGGQAGTVRVYGRLNSLGAHELIDATHWMSSGLDFESTLAQRRSETKPVVYAYPPLLQYGDLLINRADVLKTWPRVNAVVRLARKLIRFPQPGSGWD